MELRKYDDYDLISYFVELFLGFGKTQAGYLPFHHDSL